MFSSFFRKNKSAVFFSLALLSPISLYTLYPSNTMAIQPGKWDPMDQYILTSHTNGPKGLEVVDNSGKIIKSAKFQYNPEGFLSRETYFDAKGKQEGETRYLYQKNRVTQESLIDRNGKVVLRRNFDYKNDNISKVTVFDGDGTLQATQELEYKNGRLVQSRETPNMENPDVDILKITYKNNTPVLVHLGDKNGATFSTIRYKYDRENRIIERERDAGGEKSLCKYEYSADGKTKTYSYYYMSSKNWKLEKTLRFMY